jgi:hypothetical protein
MIAAEMKQVVDRVVGGQELLRLPRRLEKFHLPFSPSRRLVRVLRPLVQSLMLAVLNPGQDVLFGSGVTGQLIRD